MNADHLTRHDLDRLRVERHLALRRLCGSGRCEQQHREKCESGEAAHVGYNPLLPAEVAHSEYGTGHAPRQHDEKTGAEAFTRQAVDHMLEISR